MLYFITGNEGKFKQAKAILPELERLNLDLSEIQSLDPKEIIKHKLVEAVQHHNGQFIVEDMSLSFDALNGFPGPLIKWFDGSLGNQGMYEVLKKLGNNYAEAKIIVGLSLGKNDFHFFEGSTRGEIVAPRGTRGFGWDEIFLPEGYDKTYAEMDEELRNSIHLRRKALDKLKDFLKSV